MTDDDDENTNPALVRPKLTHPPRPWELTIERDDLHNAAQLAISVMACPDVPDWLRDQADTVAEDIGWWLTWGEGREHGAIRMVPALMHWQDAYKEMTAEFLLGIPDSVKAACPADVILARRLAEAADTVGFSMDCRMESLDSLHRTLARLKDHADEEAGQDDESDDDTIELGYNHHAST